MHGQNLHSFCTDHWPATQIWTRDADLLGERQILETLCAGTGVSFAAAQATIFATFSGVLFEGEFPAGKSSFIRPVGVYHRKRRGFGMQFCAACLRDEPKPFFKLNWRLIGFPTCTSHGLILSDRCSICRSPICLHRGGITHCDVCSADLRDTAQFPADQSVLSLQKHNEAVLTGDSVSLIPAFRGMYPLSYFRLLHRLMLITLFGVRAPAFRTAIEQKFNCELGIYQEDVEKELGFVAPSRLHNALVAVSHIISNWPHNFIEVAKDAKLWASWASKDSSAADLPYVYTKVVREHLSDPMGHRRHIQRPLACGPVP